jgi:hypothetical protein
VHFVAKAQFQGRIPQERCTVHLCKLCTLVALHPQVENILISARIVPSTTIRGSTSKGGTGNWISTQLRLSTIIISSKKMSYPRIELVELKLVIEKVICCNRVECEYRTNGDTLATIDWDVTPLLLLSYTLCYACSPSDMERCMTWSLIKASRPWPLRCISYPCMSIEHTGERPCRSDDRTTMWSLFYWSNVAHSRPNIVLREGTRERRRQRWKR